MGSESHRPRSANDTPNQYPRAAADNHSNDGSEETRRMATALDDTYMAGAKDMIGYFTATSDEDRATCLSAAMMRVKMLAYFRRNP